MTIHKYPQVSIGIWSIALVIAAVFVLGPLEIREARAAILPPELVPEYKRLLEWLEGLSVDLKDIQELYAQIQSEESGQPQDAEALDSMKNELSVNITALAEGIQNLAGDIRGFSEKLAAVPVTSPLFSRDLHLGDSGEDVKILQRFLAKDPALYPEGLITGYFGPLTLAAVKRFQCRYQIVCDGNAANTWGRVGPKTREKLNEMNIAP